ncbi:T Cell Receptor Beta Variable 12-4 [Manis pentadactyla]|nr:T Cell Receptor Beta Variable 12-4 [Manis pentadactyla]
MGSLALCCGILLFLGIESKDAGVSQTPRHRVTKTGQAVTLRCEPIPGHAALFWYRQTSMQGLQFLIYFSNREPIDKTGMPKDRFSAEMPSGSLSTLKIQPAEPGDSAVYLCASSVGTALQSHALPVQKPQLPLWPHPQPF